MRYTYLGDKMTRPDLVGVQCDPKRRPDGKCVVSVPMATAMVTLEDGTEHIVLRRRLRVNRGGDEK